MGVHRRRLGEKDVAALEFGTVAGNKINVVTAEDAADKPFRPPAGGTAVDRDHIAATRRPLAL